MKMTSILLGLGLLMVLGGGCFVRHSPHAVAVRPARVVVHTPRVRVRPVRRCAYTKCRTRCNIWGCRDRCRRVYRRCY
jgi:hypothetical protein